MTRRIDLRFDVSAAVPESGTYFNAAWLFLPDAALYKASLGVTNVTLPRSGHCHNFAGTRLQLWDEIAGWLAVSPGSR